MLQAHAVRDSVPADKMVLGSWRRTHIRAEDIRAVGSLRWCLVHSLAVAAHNPARRLVVEERHMCYDSGPEVAGRHKLTDCRCPAGMMTRAASKVRAQIEAGHTGTHSQDQSEDG